MRFLRAILLGALLGFPNLGAVVYPFVLLSSNPITVSLVKGRVADGSTDTCVTPCLMFFNATGTTDASVTSNPFHDVQYTWSFGDPASGATWSYGAGAGVNSKNAAYGPITAHVFETAGTYTVTLTAYDGTNTNSTTASVVVTDATTYFGSANTVCVSTSGTFTGCTGSTNVTSADFDATIATYAVSGKRVRFRCTETFDGSTVATVTAKNIGLIDTYGTLPCTAKVTASFVSTLTPMLRFASNSTDWRVVDLEFDGTGMQATSNALDITDGTSILFLRINAHDYGTYGLKGDPGGGAHTVNKWALVDSSMSAMTGFATNATFGIFAGTTAGYAAVMGNNIVLTSDSTRHGHSTRFPGASQVVISNNTLDRGANGFTNIDMHGYSSGGVWTGQYVEQVVISANKSIELNIAVGPQNAISDERLRNIIIERNWSLTTAATAAQSMACLDVAAQYVTVRNEICGSSSNNPHIGFLIVHTKADAGIEPAPQYVWAYNNSMVAENSTGGASAVMMRQGSNLFAKNNLAYTPLATKTYQDAGVAPIVVHDPGTATTTGGNSTNGQMKSTDPLLTYPPNTTVKWKPAGGSYAIGTGGSVPVWSDFNFVAEPSPRDIGAWVH